MAGTRFKKYDKNRQRKVYPIYHALPKYGYQSDKVIVLETMSVAFVSQTEKSFQLKQEYGSLPTLTLTPEHSSLGDLNVFISSISLSGGTVSVTIKTSATFTGNIHLQSIMLGT